MNTVGIIGAMEEEIIAIKRHMKVENTIHRAGMEFCEGTLKDQRIVVVRCGIGQVNATICTQILIDQFEVNYIINTGVAGGLYPEINIGDIVIASDTLQDHADKPAFGETKVVISPENQPFFESNTKLIDVAKEAVERLKDSPKAYVGRVASEDQFISSMKVKADIYTTFTAYCAEIEGAAIAHTCYLNQVPFVMIRVISDKADQNSEINFDEFVHLAARNVSRMIECIVERI